MKSTKAVVNEVTQVLMMKASLDGKPNIGAINKYAVVVIEDLEKYFGKDLVVLEGLVALGYAAAHFAAIGIVSTIKTREELVPQVNMVAELVSTTIRLALEAAWAQVYEPKETKPLIVSVPN